MKYITKLPDNRQPNVYSMLPITHCLIGKRKDDFERPADEILRKSNLMGKVPAEMRLTEEEQMQVRLFRIANSRGKYALHALTWVCSEEEGGQAKLLFKEPEWDQESLQLVPTRKVEYER